MKYPRLSHNKKDTYRSLEKMVKMYTFLRPKPLKNHTLWGPTYLYGLCKGVLLPTPG